MLPHEVIEVSGSLRFEGWRGVGVDKLKTLEMGENSIGCKQVTGIRTNGLAGAARPPEGELECFQHRACQGEYRENIGALSLRSIAYGLH